MATTLKPKVKASSRDQLPREIFYPRSYNFLEIYFWLLAAFVASGRIWLEIYRNTTRDHFQLPIPDIIAIYYLDILASFLLILFPVFFIFIFGSFPLSYIRSLRIKNSFIRYLDLEVVPTVDKKPLAEKTHEIPELREVVTSNLNSDSPEELLKNLASASKVISQGIYTRAGVYLLVGVLIAFLGLVFFYTQTRSLLELHDLTIILSNLAPRFGVLFFVEVIAFFFLRQYRVAMDEFKYFEAIKRNREETLVLIQLAKQKVAGLSLKDIWDKCSFYSNPGKLNVGETTELIESKKLDKNELELVEKFIDVLSRATK